MKIIVCLKEVASRETRYEVASDQRWIEESNVSFEVNECDEYALEEALKLKEKHGGEVTLLTIGSERAEKVMRKGLAKGADRGVLVVDGSRELDSPYAFAVALSQVLRDEEYDLILTGTQSDDFGYAQTGTMLAELLDVPHASIVMEVAAQEDGGLRVLREMESGWFQWVSMQMPALLTIQAGISSLRYASLKGIMQAKKKEIRKIAVSELALELETFPRIAVTRVYEPEQAGKAELFEGEASAVVEQLVEKLRHEAKVL